MVRRAWILALLALSGCISLSVGCSSVDRMKRESAQEEAVLRAWEKSAKEQAGDE